MFLKAKFIEYPSTFSSEYKTYNPAPIFKKRFSLGSKPASAELKFCALGLGIIYINGEPITEDLFLSPTSDYTKTLWYTAHEVGPLLKEGENEIAAIIGNGFYNESLKTAWDFDAAAWRGNPKLLLELTTSENNIIATDESWFAATENSPIIFNELRCGEHYDCRKGEKWLQKGADAEKYVSAAVSDSVPTGTLRECKCQPIKEFEVYKPVRIFKNAENRLIYDFGQNLSGYAEFTFKGECGQEVIMRHSERLNSDGTLQLNDMDAKHFYAECEFATNRVILSGNTDTYKPRFAYFGYRYIEIEGIEQENIISVRSIFVHQDVRKTADFECSNELLNRLFKLSGFSTLSNLFYMPTDCPTREKLGWTNDAASSCEQMLINYDTYKLFEKWMQDILDSQRPDGALPGIIPTAGWGYNEYNGPLCGSIIFELPLRMYLFKGDANIIKAAFPYMLKYLSYLESKKASDGFLAFGLWDWAGPFEKEDLPTPLRFSDTALLLRFYDIALGLSDIIKEDKKALQKSRDELYALFFGEYYDKSADRCTVSSQTALAMMIDLKDGGATDGLLAQFKETILNKDCRHECGMLGLQFLFKVLHRYDLDELAYKIITAEGHPSYKLWLDDGATTLYEMWDTGSSNNHHMNSHFLMWFFGALLGIAQKEGSTRFEAIQLKPYFPEDMDFAKGYIESKLGKIVAEWKREENEILYSVSIPEGAVAEVIAPAGFSLENTPNSTLGAGIHSFKLIKN